MNATRMPHATGVNRGSRPNTAVVTATISQTAGSCTTAVPSTVGSLPPTSPAAAP